MQRNQTGSAALPYREGVIKVWRGYASLLEGAASTALHHPAGKSKLFRTPGGRAALRRVL